MRASDEDALICDFAQFYHIYDIDSLKPSYAAILACGLPEESRSVKSLWDSKIGTNTRLLAAAVDDLNFISWLLIGGDDSGVSRPESIHDRLMGIEADYDRQYGYDTPEEFEAARRKFLEENTDG